MNLEFKLKDEKNCCGSLKKIEYNRKENGLFEVIIHSFHAQDENGNQLEYLLKIDNAQIDTDENSGVINVDPYMEIIIDYDENHEFSVINTTCRH